MGGGALQVVTIHVGGATPRHSPLGALRIPVPDEPPNEVCELSPRPHPIRLAGLPAEPYLVRCLAGTKCRSATGVTEGQITC
jgi:hypothetical protein